MKKVKFRSPGSKALYITLCVGMLAVGIASVAGYRAAVNSITDGLITPSDEADIPEIDYSAVDAVLEGIQKDAEENAPASAGETPAAEAAQPEENAAVGEAIVDITDELEALYYEQAIMMPVNGEIINAYSDGELVKSSGGVWKTHDGIDIAAEEGTAVKAMTSGTVTQVYDDPLWGTCVVIDHGNTMSGYYFGLSAAPAVAEGQTVNAGDTVGSVGSTADIESDLGSHIHFALRYQDQWIDPIGYIEPMK